MRNLIFFLSSRAGVGRLEKGGEIEWELCGEERRVVRRMEMRGWFLTATKAGEPAPRGK